MRKKEKIISIRKHPPGKVSRENLWFFSEDGVHASAPISENKPKNRDGFRMIYEDYDPFMSKTSERNKLKMDCSFVVDWQLSDSL